MLRTRSRRPPLPPRDTGRTKGLQSALPWQVAAIAAAAVLLRAGIAFTTHFTNEDSLITLRYAENLAGGHGLVYNPGEKVLGTTTPLYALLLALAARLGLPALATGKALNILAAGLLCVVVYRWLRAVGQEGAGRLAALWVAAHPLLIRWSLSGMETGLVTLCGSAVWLAYAERRLRTAYVLLAVLFLLRWDSLLLLAVLTAAVVVRERRLPAKELGLFALLISPWLLAAWQFYGSPIPVTAAAKATVYGWRYRAVFLPELGHLLRHFAGGPLPLLAAGLALAGLLRAGRERLPAVFPAAVWAALYWCGFLLSKVLLFEWYIPPTLPLQGVLVALGLAPLLGRGAARVPAGVQRAIGVAAAAGVLAIATWVTGAGCRSTQKIEDHLRIPMALWLKANSRPNDRVMLEPIGHVGYHSGLRVLDTVGLVSPEVLRFWTPQNRAPMREIALAYRPEWCVLRPGELGHIIEAEGYVGAWHRQYRLARTFSYQRSPRVGPMLFYVFRRSDTANSSFRRRWRSSSYVSGE